MDLATAFRNADDQEVPETLVRRPSAADTTWNADDLGLPDRMSGDGPLVSVIVPTYGDSQYLPDALESVGAQTYRNLELVVVDSSGVEWVEELGTDRDWITYLLREPTGVSTARNDGIEVATGTYVALLDADDYWHPAKIEQQVDVLEDGHDAVFSDAYLLKHPTEEPTVQYLQLVAGSEESVHQAYLNGGAIATSSLVFRRKQLPSRPFNEALHGAEDLVLCVEFFRSHPPVRIPAPLCVWRVRESSLTDDRERMYHAKIEAMAYLAERYPELQQAIDARLSLVYFNRGQELLAEGQKQTARQLLKLSVGRSVWNYRAVGLYLVSCLPVDGETMIDLLRRIQTVLSSDSLEGQLSIRPVPNETRD